MRVSGLVGVLAGFTAASCLLTTDFSSVVGVRPDGGAPVDAPVAVGPDGGSDGGAVDGATSASPCAAGAMHVFCSDFDNVDAPPVPGWATTATMGTVGFDATNVVSPPHAFGASVKSLSPAFAYLSREAFVGAYKTATLGFDLRLTDCQAQGSTSLTFVYIKTGLTTAIALVIRSVGSLAIGAQVDQTFSFFNLEQPVPANTWKHLVMKLTPGNATAMHVLATVDGVKAVDTDAPSGLLEPTMTFNVGISAGTAAPVGCQLAYDNVVFDKE